MDKDLKRGLFQLAIATAILMAIVITLGQFFRPSLEAMGTKFVEVLGYPGIGLGILIADMFTFVIPPDFYLFVAITAELNPFWVITIGSLGSIVGGLGAYQLGRWLDNTRFVKRMMQPLRNRGDAFINRTGLIAVIIAALTPIPFSVTCMAAGSLRMNPFRFFLCTLCRIPRIAGYYWIIVAGWTL